MIEFTCCKQNITKKKANIHPSLFYKPIPFFKRITKEGHSVVATNLKKATTLFYSKYDSTPTLFEDKFCSLIVDSYWAYLNFTCNSTYKVNDKGVYDELRLKGKVCIPHCLPSADAKAAQFARHGTKTVDSSYVLHCHSSVQGFDISKWRANKYPCDRIFSIFVEYGKYCCLVSAVIMYVLEKHCQKSILETAILKKHS